MLVFSGKGFSLPYLSWYIKYEWSKEKINETRQVRVILLMDHGIYHIPSHWLTFVSI